MRDAAAANLVALVDESFRVIRGGHYVLAAALVPEATLDDLRASLRTAVPASIAHFRWAKEREPLRRKMVATIEALDVASLVVVTTPVAPRRQERARAACLERLAWELAQRRVGRLLVESRGEQDSRDRRVLAGLQRRQVIPGSVHYAFGTKADPALWVPDAIAGAVMAQRCEDDDQHVAGLSRLTVIVMPASGG